MRYESWIARAAGGLAPSLPRVLGRGRLAILTYHRVPRHPDPLLPDEPDQRAFDLQMGVLASRFKPMTLLEAMERLAKGSLPGGAVCITFDDGYADNALVALPILRKWKIPATFFIATGFLNGGRMFNDTILESLRRMPGERLDTPWLGLSPMSLHDANERRVAFEAVVGAVKYRPPDERAELVGRLEALATSELPSDLMMTSSQVRMLLAAGMSVGAHTRNHPILARVSAADARAEIEAGKAELEGIVGDKVELFAYPNGRPTRDYLPEHVEMARSAGFRFAAATQWGCVTRGSHPLQLPRIPQRGRARAEFALRTAHVCLSRSS